MSGEVPGGVCARRGCGATAVLKRYAGPGLPIFVCHDHKDGPGLSIVPPTTRQPTPAPVQAVQAPTPPMKTAEAAKRWSTAPKGPTIDEVFDAIVEIGPCSGADLVHHFFSEPTSAEETRVHRRRRALAAEGRIEKTGGHWGKWRAVAAKGGPQPPAPPRGRALTPRSDLLQASPLVDVAKRLDDLVDRLDGWFSPSDAEVQVTDLQGRVRELEHEVLVLRIALLAKAGPDTLRMLDAELGRSA